MWSSCRRWETDREEAIPWLECWAAESRAVMLKAGPAARSLWSIDRKEAWVTAAAKTGGGGRGNVHTHKEVSERGHATGMVKLWISTPGSSVVGSNSSLSIKRPTGAKLVAHVSGTVHRFQKAGIYFSYTVKTSEFWIEAPKMIQISATFNFTEKWRHMKGVQSVFFFGGGMMTTQATSHIGISSTTNLLKQH